MSSPPRATATADPGLSPLTSGDRSPPSRDDRSAFGFSKFQLTPAVQSAAPTFTSMAVPSGSVGRGRVHPEVYPLSDKPERAAEQRLQELTRRVTEHQNRHVKMRAQLTVEVDKARWESDQCDFRLAELQAQLESIIHALRERIKSRLETAAQVRHDTHKQIEAVADAELRSLLRATEQDAQQALRERSDAVATLAAMQEQLGNHIDVQFASLSHKFQTGGVGSAQERIAATKAAVLATARKEKQSLDAMLQMISEFAQQARGQLEEMRAEREHFESRFMQRLDELSRLDPRRAGE